jgi:uncharacterized SAM-binding protein YcdF (DUF218 family)
VVRTVNRGVSIAGIMRAAARGGLWLPAALGWLVLLITFSPLIDWWTAALTGPWNDPRGEVLIVLAGDSAGDGFLGRSSYWRTFYAAGVWAEGGWSRVVISGGETAGQMKRLLVSWGVPDGAIEVETASASTRENALFLARQLKGVPGSKVLLTSDFHMARAWRALRAAGLDTAPRPIPDSGKQAATLAERWPVFLRLGEETAKLLYYKARGWI